MVKLFTLKGNVQTRIAEPAAGYEQNTIISGMSEKMKSIVRVIIYFHRANDKVHVSRYTVTCR